MLYYVPRLIQTICCLTLCKHVCHLLTANIMYTCMLFTNKLLVSCIQFYYEQFVSYFPDGAVAFLQRQAGEIGLSFSTVEVKSQFLISSPEHNIPYPAIIESD